MSVSKSRVEDAAKARLSADVVGYSLGTPSAAFLADGKGGPDAVFARQVAMYLCYTGFELSLARVAVAFERDRSTVSHACHRIEDRRDEPVFDQWIESLEAMVRRAPREAGIAQHVQP
ncbi:MAG: chromosomal replication initiator DnaA [Proteobacteria bacterium]|nr:chromosomal replication initiator DnaA [Pseudomonadota bacterium]